MIHASTLLLAMQLISAFSFAADNSSKGLIPEIRLNDNEDQNDQKSFSSEVMITRTENQAIASLQAVIAKKKGSPEEADLWYRLAELYMRRSKSGRFFDLHKDTALLKLSPFPIANKMGAEAVKRAVKIYSKIENDFPKFQKMDEVFFNNAFANQQIGQIKTSEGLYNKLLAKFPKSPLIPDGTLAIGELLYDQGKFKEALHHFINIEKFPNSRVYSYALYKAAWSYYNLRDSDNGINKLISVVKINAPLKDGEIPTNRHNLRREALRDLTIFVGDTYPASKLYSFFEEITKTEELGHSMSDLAKLYESHSRQKEMSIFLDEFIEKQSSSFEIVKFHMYLVNANEDLKKRNLVLSHLQTASELCKKDSVWRAGIKPDQALESCQKDFHHTSLELAKKWWETWLKNKQVVEFSNLTEQLFKIILDNEDPAKPDYKTRYAYAELLFQQEKYDEASAQYKIVGGSTTEEPLRHDANYASLFAKEKSIGKAKDPLKEAERKELADNYLAKHPTGKFASLVLFKKGHIAYEEGNYAEAEKILRPLSQNSSLRDPSIKRKSEDLVLDILNIRKDYTAIKEFSKLVLATGSDINRKQELGKILEEAHFSEIQEFAKTGDKTKAADQLLIFAKEHENSKLAKDALWQALSLEYSQGHLFSAAELSIQFVKKYPEDSRKIDALKEASKAYAEIGQLARSAETLLKIAELDKKTSSVNLELAADIYILEQKLKEARSAYLGILSGADQKTSERIYTKLFDSYKSEPESKELEKLKNQVMSKGLEPYTTKFMIEKARAFLNSGKDSAAFDLAMKANAREVSAEIRAEARLIQARILEKELTQQSVKSREEKFAMVLSLKTEKLEKAQTAFYSALKMTKDPKQQLEALRGIDRCYTNFIFSLRNMPLPPTLSIVDQTALRAEIAKITTPIEEKKRDNDLQLETLTTAQGSVLVNDRIFANIHVDQTIPPLAQYPSAEKMTPFLPASIDMTIGKVTRFQLKNKYSCIKNILTPGAFTAQNAPDTLANCFYAKQFEGVEKAGLELAKNKETRALGLFYSSLGAEARGFADKALWLIDLAIKNQSEAAPFLYQKARLIYQKEGLSAASTLFDKVIAMQIPSTEIQTFAGVKAYTEQDFSQALQYFSTLSKEQMYNLGVGTLMSEAYAQKGEVEKALSLVKEFLGMKGEETDFLLQQAHLFETYKASPTLALAAYEKALKTSRQPDLQDWLNKKIKYLKNQNKVGQNVNPGDF